MPTGNHCSSAVGELRLQKMLELVPYTTTLARNKNSDATYIDIVDKWKVQQL